jgi:hypothetical protein
LTLDYGKKQDEGSSDNTDEEPSGTDPEPTQPIVELSPEALKTKKTLEKVRIKRPRKTIEEQQQVMQQMEQELPDYQASDKPSLSKPKSVHLKSRQSNSRSTSRGAEPSLHKQFYTQRGSLNYENQSKECNRINKDNQRLAATLIKIKPSINFKKMDGHHQKKQKLQSQISRFETSVYNGS